jgi:NhaP-type Na+/H+ and K+/H+ antiporter
MIMVVMAKNALLKFNFAFLICISFLLIEGMPLENEKIRNGHMLSRIEEEMDFEGVSL